MSRKFVPTPQTRRRRTPRWLAVLGALALGLAAVLLLAVDTAPRVAASAPDATVAHDALAAGEALRAFATSGASQGSLTLREAEINAVLASAARLAPGAHGAARVSPEGVKLDLSLGAPWLPAGLWANVGLDIAAPADGLRIERAHVGRLPLPPALVEAALLRGVDRALGGEAGLGRAALDGVERVSVEGDAVVVNVAHEPNARAALLAQLRARLDIGDEAQLEPIRRQLYWLHRTAAEGGLPGAGSIAPYLREIVLRAERMSRRLTAVSDADLAAGGLLALALYCGEPALGAAIGVGPTDAMRGGGNICDGATLGGRDDLKRHFAVSAGLYAASTGQAAFGVGELKELIDSGQGGSGFSFDDMAANLSGARFAAAFLATPRADWPALRALITDEAAILPATGDLPRGLSAADFAARFGDVDSAAYRTTIAEIERRIDALPLHRARAGG